MNADRFEMGAFTEGPGAFTEGPGRLPRDRGPERRRGALTKAGAFKSDILRK